MPPKGDSKRKRSKRRRPASGSSLVLDFEHAISMPGGVRRTIDLLRSATDADLRCLPSDYSPLVAPIVLAGSTYTRRRGTRVPATLMPALLCLADLCRSRGVSVDGGSLLGDHLLRPLVAAAYYGLVPLVERLLDLGARPDLADGDGRTALHAALQNPSGQLRSLRGCDAEVARALFLRGAATPDLGRWRAAPAGTVLYANGDALGGSAMLTAVREGNVDSVSLLRELGAVVTDRDFLLLRAGGQVRSRLLPTVARVEGIAERSGEKVESWSIDVDWSFPPTWKVAVSMSLFCGLPRDVFRHRILPYCPRDWFYESVQATALPPRLGSSMGGERKNMLARAVDWRDPT